MQLCTKNYENPSIFVPVTAKNMWHLFFWTRCINTQRDDCSTYLPHLIAVGWEMTEIQTLEFVVNENGRWDILLQAAVYCQSCLVSSITTRLCWYHWPATQVPDHTTTGVPDVELRTCTTHRWRSGNHCNWRAISHRLSKPHTGTTNGLRHVTQFGLPMK